MKATDSKVLPQHMSDHKVVACSFQLRLRRCEEGNVCKHKPFHVPSWLEPDEWSQIVEQAFQHGCRLDWMEACSWVEELFPYDDQQVDEQYMVNYGWCLYQAKLIWSMRLAYQMFLQDAPLEVEMVELDMITHLANHAQRARLKPPKWQKRTYPVNAQVQTQRMRKWRAKLGRCLELRQILMRRGMDNTAKDLVRKIFGRYKRDVANAELDDMIHRLREDIQQQEKDTKHSRLARWRDNMKNLKQRSQWINRKFNALYPSVTYSNATSTTKEEAISMLQEYTADLQQRLPWSF